MNRTRKARWSLVLMRGADKTVKQFHVSKRSVVAAPAAAVLAVSGCIAGLQIKSAFAIDSLEDQMSEQQTHYADTVSAKDDSIAVLQQEIARLSTQAKQLQTQVNDLEALESKLQQFIEKYGTLVEPGDGDPDFSSGKASSRTEVQALSLNGSSADDNRLSSSIAYSKSQRETRQLAALASTSSLDFQALSTMVDAMEQTMAVAWKEQQLRQAKLDALPSRWPTSSRQMTSGFGYRKDPFTGKATFHAGIDISGKSGDPVFSAANGTVTESGYSSSEGNHIVIDHGNGLQSVYMHLKAIEARTGDTVVRGEKIGLLGSTGRSTGSHLHFQIMQKNEAVNPLLYLRRANSNV
ncbi:M23 family metallopeptidase [Paenibacillus sp. NPDC058071]|uniref:M23 family metallopeptidase n=1 Tax=Paenibacillus sp. NPDC058071 TaxID=3346326 RepID=UPI0036DBA008